MVDRLWIQLTFGCRGMSWLHCASELTQLVHLFPGITALSPASNQSGIGGWMGSGIHFTEQWIS